MLYKPGTVITIRHSFYKGKRWRIVKGFPSLDPGVMLYRVQLLRQDGTDRSDIKPITVIESLIKPKTGGSTMKNWEQELKAVKTEVSQAGTERVVLETRLEEAKKRKSDAIGKLKAKGVDPKNLKQTLTEKEQKLEETIASIRECLPGDEDAADDEDED